MLARFSCSHVCRVSGLVEPGRVPIAKTEETMSQVRWLTLVLTTVLAIALGASMSSAGTITLAEWAVNLDGAVSDSLVPDPVPGNVNLAGFDTTTGLGTVTMTITGAGSHYAGLFVDHEIDESLNGFSNEQGSVLGVAPGDVSWEIDEPGFAASPGDIFINFTNSALDNTNPPRWPDDVSMALAYSFSLAPGEKGIVRFNISTTNPGGFALEQTDPDSNGGPVFFTTDLRISGGSAVPEPSVIALLGSGLVSLIGFAARRHRQ